MFYRPNHCMRIVETENTRFIENGEINGSTVPRDVEIKEVKVQVPLTSASSSKVITHSVVVPTNNEEGQHNNESMIHNEPIMEEPQKVALKRSQRERRPTISNDYVVYLHEREKDLSINDNDLVSSSQVISYDSSDKWLDAVKEELHSMEHNGVWGLIKLPMGCKRVGCKWVFKTKCDSHDNLECYKARFVAKGFIQKDDIDYKETFSPVSRKHSFRIIMTLVAHYELELHHMDAKNAFLIGDLEENIYMDQSMGFLVEGKEHMV